MVSFSHARSTAIITCFLALAGIGAHAQQSPRTHKTNKSWRFAFSGDSRNCGNVVMPAIAAAVKKDGEAFYWHLGDFRVISRPDEDYLAEPKVKAGFDGGAPDKASYLSAAWDDFLSHQIALFAPVPVYLAPGNHETAAPKTHDELLNKFQRWFDKPELKAQRLKDDPSAIAPTAYYHWIRSGVDFISLDNSLDSAYDENQLKWFFALVSRDEADKNIRTIVVGMHEALPDSLSAGHSMCSTSDGITSGRAVYKALVHARQAAHKKVYVLASHSHFYLENAYNTPYWNDPKNGGVVLPGWVVGTAGAVRYKLPPDLPPGTVARDHVYGYMTGTVAPDGAITFAFHELSENALKRAKTAGYTDDFIDQCFNQNPPIKNMKWFNEEDPCKEKQQ